MTPFVWGVSKVGVVLLQLSNNVQVLRCAEKECETSFIWITWRWSGANSCSDKGW